MEADLVMTLLVIGLPGALWPYKLTRFIEQVDAIGSKRSSSEVEPADWAVALTRIIGIALVAYAILGLITG